ncbi:dephospho-CoA kinase [Brachybacterium halotolerans subsp. kimchii]|uniref:dephospho-CoA kinase n=1 Tax=Brachybacterium halotolerans TaxID=2795215 RepID=UPI001E34E87F|nr:dephospho-CoA kinase [Brachybacterium halotolerans]UEJ83270.1 dephospho-CoA kinase [Brachybacterium halotolerans subsp. kimchii]
MDSPTTGTASARTDAAAGATGTAAADTCRDAAPGLVRLGLTGGIGAGKSSVAGIWRDAGTAVIDLDAHSRAVLDVPGEGVEEAVARFGEEYRAASGTIDRAALARLVFADAAARADLEEIVLTRVDAAVEEAEREAAAAGERLVVHDSPLLLEKHHEDEYARVVAVLAPREERIARVVRDRGRDRAYVESVMAAQATDLERIRRADRLLLNNADAGTLRTRALTLLEDLRRELLGGPAGPAEPIGPAGAASRTARVRSHTRDVRPGT